MPFHILYAQHRVNLNLAKTHVHTFLLHDASHEAQNDIKHAADLPIEKEASDRRKQVSRRQNQRYIRHQEELSER